MPVGNDDDDVAGWEDVDGTFVFDCNDNVVISEAGVASVVATVNRRDERMSHSYEKKGSEMKIKARYDDKNKSVAWARRLLGHKQSLS